MRLIIRLCWLIALLYCIFNLFLIYWINRVQYGDWTGIDWFGPSYERIRSLNFCWFWTQYVEPLWKSGDPRPIVSSDSVKWFVISYLVGIVVCLNRLIHRRRPVRTTQNTRLEPLRIPPIPGIQSGQVDLEALRQATSQINDPASGNAKRQARQR